MLAITLPVMACQNESSEIAQEEPILDVNAIGARITKEQGESWTKTYQSHKPDATRGFLFGKDI